MRFLGLGKLLMFWGTGHASSYPATLTLFSLQRESLISECQCQCLTRVSHLH